VVQRRPDCGRCDDSSVAAVSLISLSQAEPLPRQLASFIARLASSANLWPNTVHRARRRNADITDQGRATIAVALHAPKMMVGKCARDAIEIVIVLGREARPVARKRAASAAGLTGRGCFR
jgi:hypothetical protein